MKKIWSLIKATLSSDMQIFKYKSKSDKKSSRILFVVFLVILLGFSIGSYAAAFMDQLTELHLEFVVVTLFILLTAILTLIEGIYKAGTMMFNCKDDNLLLSLPVRKSTVLFVRILKFYLFELLYNSLFLAPAMIAYTLYVNVGISYYIVCIISLLVLPIIPIAISCLIGGIVSQTSTKFKYKNIAQIVLITIFLLLMLYVSFNFNNILNNLAANANNINDLITKLYYPAGVFNRLIHNFNILELLLFIVIHIVIFVLTIFVLSKVYFKINSRVKEVNTDNKSSKYKIKTHGKTVSFIKKEFNRFINTPVFVTNAAFGLVLYVAACILICFKFEDLVKPLIENNIVSSLDQAKAFLPIITFVLICFASLTSSITSSMISLEGKSFIILRSLPISPARVIFSKVLTALVVMLPFIFIGDIILFIRFSFNILEIIMLLISSVILPLVAETIGILINLKYPKMEFDNDSEVVKQSMSSAVSVFVGMFLIAITVGVVVKVASMGINTDLLLLIGLGFYIILFMLLMLYMNKKSVKDFNNIMV